MIAKMTIGVVLMMLSPVSPVSPVEARDAAQVRAFRADHPCPATGKTKGACANFVVDHQIPLCAGGPDAPANMIWQEQKASYVKDQLERSLCRRLKSCPLGLHG